MNKSRKSASDSVIWLLTLFSFVSFIIFENFSWGRYVFLGSSVLIGLISCLSCGGVLKLHLRPYHWFLAIFIIYIFFNSVWAENTSATISKAITISQIFFCFSLIYMHYDQKDNVNDLLSAVKWGGFIVSIYAIFYYGFENLAFEGSEGLGDGFSNINTIGMVASLACVIQAYEMLNKRSGFAVVFAIPSFIMVAATKSRKAFVLLVLGVIGLFLLHNAMKGRNVLKKMGKTLLIIAAVFLVVSLLIRLPMLEGTMIRLERMFAFWTGEGRVDTSTTIRNKMIDVGMDYFRKYPIGGYGIGNSSIIAQFHVGKSTYLHNNYVEMLSCGGIIGFLIYYSIHAYLLFGLYRYRKAAPELFVIGFVWLVMIFIMDWGMVSYYSKEQWFYLMIHFLNVSNMKRKFEEQRSEGKRIV